MRLLCIFLTACLVLAAAQAVAAVLCVLLVAGLVYGLFVAPRETFGLVGLCLIASLVQTQPFFSLAVIALTLLSGLLRRRE